MFDMMSLGCRIKAPKNRSDAQPFNPAVDYSWDVCSGVKMCSTRVRCRTHTQSPWGRAVNPGKDSAQRSDGAPLVRSRLVSEESLYLTQKTCVPSRSLRKWGLARRASSRICLDWLSQGSAPPHPPFPAPTRLRCLFAALR